MTYVLWTIQALLAALFMFGGVFKLITPMDDLYAQMPLALPGIFVRFIGLCEVLGALGLVLPGLLRIRRDLTPLAAKCLVVLMVGAAMFTPAEAPIMAALPIVVGLLAAAVAIGRANYGQARVDTRSAAAYSSN